MKKGTGKIIIGTPLGVLYLTAIFNNSKDTISMVILSLLFFSLTIWGLLQRRNPEVQKKFEERKQSRKAEYERLQAEIQRKKERHQKEKARLQEEKCLQEEYKQRERQMLEELKRKEQISDTSRPSVSSSASNLNPFREHDGSSIRPSGDGSWIVNPNSIFPLTVYGIDKAIAEKLKSLLDNKEGSEGTYYVTQKVLPMVARYNIKCKELDDYIKNFKPVYLKRIEEQIRESTEWTTASELDREDILAEFKENAIAYLDIRPDCDLEILFEGDKIDLTVDDGLIDIFGYENIDFYLINRKKNVHIIPSDHYDRKKFEKLVEAGLAVRGDNIPLKSIVESLKLKEMLALVSDLNPPKFSRKAKTIEYLLQLPDLKERLNKNISFRSLFQLQLLPEKFANIDLEKVSLSWQYAHIISELIVETYFLAEYSMQQHRDINDGFLKGWQIVSDDDCCPHCKRAATKNYSKNQFPKVPLHIGCKCNVMPLF
jgi:hypothetical protein